MTVLERPATAPAIDGPTIGLIAQVMLLAGLSVGVGLGALGWITGATCAATGRLLLRRALHGRGDYLLGPANRITLARGTLVGGVSALIADGLVGPERVVPLVALATVALVLDAVDGQVARRTGSVSPLGARFDMEVDAFLILVLSIGVVHALGWRAAWWVIAIGALRYAFLAAAGLLPWLRAPLRPRYSRKVVAALQGIVLVAASSGVLPEPVTLTALGAALALLTWSFGLDVIRLLRSRPNDPSLAPARAAAASCR